MRNAFIAHELLKTYCDMKNFARIVIMPFLTIFNVISVSVLGLMEKYIFFDNEFIGLKKDHNVRIKKIFEKLFVYSDF